MLPKKQMASVAMPSEGMKERRNLTNPKVEAQDTNVEELALSQGEALMPKSKKG